MDNKEAIKILRKGYPDINKYAASELEAYDYDVETYDEAVVYAISHLEEERWNSIHTEADLPKESDWYLVTRVFNSRKYVATVFFNENTKSFYEDSCTPLNNITAWKPLPKPYESEDK